MRKGIAADNNKLKKFEEVLIQVGLRAAKKGERALFVICDV